MASPFVAPYASTKFALNGFFGSLQHELAMKNSNVSLTICTLVLSDTDSAMEKVKWVKSVTFYIQVNDSNNVDELLMKLVGTDTGSFFEGLVRKLPFGPMVHKSVMDCDEIKTMILYYLALLYLNVLNYCVLC